MRKLGVSRRELFESIEKPALAPLPDADWEYAEWRRVRANLDYHVEVDGFYYSVPHALIRAEIDVRITARTIELVPSQSARRRASTPLGRPSARH